MVPIEKRVAASHGDALSMRDVAFRYPSTGFGLRVPAFSLARGEAAFLRGPSGSGKTTFLGLATGLLVPDAGSVTLAGMEETHDLATLSGPRRDRLRASSIGVIHQQFNLLPYADVTTNTVLPLAFAKGGMKDATGRARALLDRLGIPERLHRARASSLSVGQQQRVAIARALLGRPSLVVADEPTSALDVHARDRFLDLLFGAVAETGAALLMVSHDPAIGERFDRSLDLTEIAEVTE